MKTCKFLIVLALAALALSPTGPACAQQRSDLIERFFADYLAAWSADYDTQPDFQASFKVTPKRVDDYAFSVWEAWVQANRKFDEQPLPELVSLDKVRAGRWTLPERLEPDAVMPFYWGAKGDAPEAGYPLFLYLHGSGDKEREWANGLTFAHRFDDAPAAYFVPQIPNTGEWYRWWQPAKQFAWEKLLRQAFVSGRIDPLRVYFFGISEGGYGSQRLASFYADYLAGAGPMAGGEPLINAPVENCAHVAFSFLTGAEDHMFYRNTLTTYTREEFERLEAAHPGLYRHRIELIPGRGHSIDYTPTTPWLKVCRRNPHPRYVAWEDFEMGGRHRNGFYNLYVVERPAERTFYEMQIEDNTIDLQVSEVAYTATEIDPRWGIQMKFKKSYAPVESGKIIVYLNDKLVNLNRPVILNVNGREAFRGKVQLDLRRMINSCAAFFDPERIYPAAIEVDLAALQ